MGKKQTKIIKNGLGKPVGVRIRPVDSTLKQLLTFTEGNIFNVDNSTPRMCRVIDRENRHIYFGPEYLDRVSRMEPSQRDRHVAATVNCIVGAESVSVFHGGSKERE